MISRRSFVSGFTALAGALAFTRPARAAHAGLTVGAIRWDPWYEQTGGVERAAMEASLGPAAWQGRAPSCASATDANHISFGGCGTQMQIDAEIAAAHAANLDYWAYCWYGASANMMAGWRLHQSSSVKNQMNWSLLYASYTLFAAEVAAAPLLSALTGYLAQSNYQRVTVASVSRPLIYLLADSVTLPTLATSITSLRSACTAASVPNPYIVLLGSTAAGNAATAGADAVGVYAYAYPPSNAGAYASLVSNAEGEWTALATTGQAIVPTVMTGWDRRPRIERPVPWEAATQAPFIGWLNYFVAGTATAIAAHVQDMLTWMGNNAAANPSRTGLIYSWDEHDEGGSTLNPSLGGGSTILNAVGGVL